MSEADPTAPEADDTITPAARTADHTLGPVRGSTSLTGVVERSAGADVAVCLHAWRPEDVGITIGNDDDALAVEASAHLTPDEARELAEQLEALADRLVDV